MPLQATSGAASYDAFGGGVPVVPNYIEEVFSTYLYTGNGSTQTITNGIDLSTKGGLVWLKNRSSTYSHRLFDTTRGATQAVASNTTDAQFTQSGLTAFNTTGFDIGSAAPTNDSGLTFASWTFRKQPKFFDVVTYTGTGSAVTVNHNLGSTPGCIIIKATSNTGNWHVWHRSVVDGSGYGYLVLNSTDAAAGGKIINSTSSTNFVVASGLSDVGYTYVCYVFAHDAGGFGLTGTDNVISCGSYVGNGSNTNGTNVDLGYEPQWLLIKKSSSGTSDWLMVDNMRGMTADGTDEQLKANSSGAADETTAVIVKSTGFQLKATGNPNTSGETYIYIAIRRGPMKVPTSGTSVFYPYAASSPGNAVVTTGFPVDFQMQKNAGSTTDMRFVDRLRGVSTTSTSPSAAFPFLVPSGTTAESTGTGTTLDWGNTGFTVGNTYASSATAWAVNFRRAPSFFDEVCYTGDGGNPQVVTHNLTVVPEMIFVKARSIGYQWISYHSALGTGSFMELNSTAASVAYAAFPSVSATTFSADSSYNRASGQTFVAYLFATCLGVSKVFSYTGNGSSQTINCGFTGGARFILIKRTDDVGDWYVWDTARGIVAGNDPYLRLNSTAAEVTSNDTIDTDSTGFVVNQVSATNVNVSSATYIGLAIA
jgi:hypothetical protein